MTYQPKPYARLQLLRTLNRLGATYILYESYYTGWSRILFDEKKKDGAFYLGDMNFPEDNNPDNRWIKFNDAKLRRNRV